MQHVAIWWLCGLLGCMLGARMKKAVLRQVTKSAQGESAAVSDDPRFRIDTRALVVVAAVVCVHSEQAGSLQNHRNDPVTY